VSRLGEHFGEPLARPCGHCSWCLGGQKPVKVPPRAVPVIDPRLRTSLDALRAAHLEALGEARSAARLLCGLSSPRLGRARLGSDPLFGALAHVPFAEVLKWVGG
jgi:ATP-dependent DNA helicase RecQ